MKAKVDGNPTELPLNPVQRAAAEWDQGPLLVLAGPGSGKTRVLTDRIAHILGKTPDKHFRILALTFTNKAADEMRQRVESLVPRGTERVFIGTFHSFCAELLRKHGIHVDVNPNFNIYSTQKELQDVLDEAVEEAKKRCELVTDLDKKTLPVIQRLKSRLILPEECENQFRDPEFGKRMAVVYPTYEQELSKRNALDFDSLILKAFVLVTKFPAFSKHYRQIYHYICLDEFQDTTLAQYKFIRALAADEYQNLFVVADDDQIIYQWNGASYQRLKEFTSDYSPKVTQLPTNYRCPPEVVSLANNLIEYNLARSPGKKPLKASKRSSGDDVVRLQNSFDNVDEETSWIAQDILLRPKNRFQSVVILARNRRLLQSAQKGLERAGISSLILQRKDEFTSTPFMWLNSVLCLANNPQDEQHLQEVCGAFEQMTGVGISSDDVISSVNQSNSNLFQSWVVMLRKEISDPTTGKIVTELWRDLVQARDFQTFCRFAVKWFDELVAQRKGANQDPLEEPFAGYQEERSVWDELTRERLNTLGSDGTLEAFVQELQMRSKEPRPRQDSVSLMTIHGAKGKEFEHVYLMGLVEDELPSFQSRKKGDDSLEMEEERRNCYVAITRTIETLTLTYSNLYNGWQKKPSRFLFEMGLLE